MIEGAQTLSHYLLVEQIGAGGMGVVYKAWDDRLRRHAAVKVLPADVVGNPERRARFLREARTAGAINHPNITTIYEVGEDEGAVFIAMELIEGRTLRSMLLDGALPSSETLRIADGVLAGLARAHQAGIVHRDLKPENVMVTEDEQVKILDFGLAKIVEEQEQETRSSLSQATTDIAQLTRGDMRLGTWAYMSPEQAQGRAVDARSDLFSFGIMLYEMATGRNPFQAGTPFEMVHAILNREIEPASRHSAELLPALDDVLFRCLEKRPENRYPGAADLRKDLDRIQRLASTGEIAVGAQLAWSARRVGRWAATPAGMGSLLAVAAIAALWLAWRTPLPTPPELDPNVIAVFPFTIRGSGEFGYLQAGMVDLLTTRLDEAGTVRSVDPVALLAYLGPSNDPVDAGRARAAAAHFGAGHYVLGAVVTAGGALQINSSLYENGGAEEPVARARATVEGEEPQLLSLVSSLAAELLADWQVLDPGAEERTTLPITDDLAALKEYLRGLDLLRAVDPENAFAAFTRATEIDPAFALAHYGRLRAITYLGDGRKVEIMEESLRLALENKERLPDRYLRIVEALALGLDDGDEMIRRLRAALDRHPDDVELNYLVAEKLLHHGQRRHLWLDEAERGFETVLRYQPNHGEALLHLDMLLATQGRFEETVALARRALQVSEDEAMQLQWRAIEAIDGGDAEKREAFLQEAAALPDEALLGLLAWMALSGHHHVAAALSELAVEPGRFEPMRAESYRYLAGIELAAGRWDAAQERLPAVGAIDPFMELTTRALFATLPFVELDRAALEALREELLATTVEDSDDRAYFLSLLSVRLDDADAVAVHTAELERIWSERDDSVREWRIAIARDIGRGMRAELLWRRGEVGAARAEMEPVDVSRASELFFRNWRSLVQLRYMRAVLLEAAGEIEESLPWYLSLGTVGDDETFWIAPKHLWVGRVYEKMGDTENARLHYEKFVELWSDCDPRFAPLRDEVRERLSRTF